MITHHRKSDFYPRLVAFFALAFAWSWICWLLSSVLRPQLSTLGMVLFLAGSFGPGIAAIAVVRYSSRQDGLSGRAVSLAQAIAAMAVWLALAGALVFLAFGGHGTGRRWAHRLGRHDRTVSCIRAYALSGGKLWPGAAAWRPAG